MELVIEKLVRALVMEFCHWKASVCSMELVIEKLVRALVMELVIEKLM
jgi:hypothetical protein